MSFVAKGFRSELCLARSCIMSCLFSLLQSGAVAQFFLDFMTLQYFRRLKASYLVDSPSIWVCHMFPHLGSGDVPLAGM